MRGLPRFSLQQRPGPPASPRPCCMASHNSSRPHSEAQRRSTVQFRISPRDKPTANTVSFSPSCSTQRRAQQPPGTAVDTTSDGIIAETTHREKETTVVDIKEASPESYLMPVWSVGGQGEREEEADQDGEEDEEEASVQEEEGRRRRQEKTRSGCGVAHRQGHKEGTQIIFKKEAKRNDFW